MDGENRDARPIAGGAGLGDGTMERGAAVVTVAGRETAAGRTTAWDERVEKSKAKGSIFATDLTPALR